MPIEQYRKFLAEHPEDAALIVKVLRDLADGRADDPESDPLRLVARGSAHLAADQVRMERLKAGLALAFEVASTVVFKKL